MQQGSGSHICHLGSCSMSDLKQASVQLGPLGILSSLFPRGFILTCAPLPQKKKKSLCSYCVMWCLFQVGELTRVEETLYRLCSSLSICVTHWHRRKGRTARLLSAGECTAPWSILNCLGSRGCQSLSESGLRSDYSQPGLMLRKTEPAR